MSSISIQSRGVLDIPGLRESKRHLRSYGAIIPSFSGSVVIEYTPASLLSTTLFPTFRVEPSLRTASTLCKIYSFTLLFRRQPVQSIGVGILTSPFVIVLAEPRAVSDGGLRPIWDRGGTPRTHVTAGGSRAWQRSRPEPPAPRIKGIKGIRL
jgi:hypothetical protein